MCIYIYNYIFDLYWYDVYMFVICYTSFHQDLYSSTSRVDRSELRSSICNPWGSCATSVPRHRQTNATWTEHGRHMKCFMCYVKWSVKWYAKCFKWSQNFYLSSTQSKTRGRDARKIDTLQRCCHIMMIVCAWLIKFGGSKFRRDGCNCPLIHGCDSIHLKTTLYQQLWLVLFFSTLAVESKIFKS